MPSTYTVNLGIEKPATGEQSGTWGDTANDNYNILDEAVNGVVSITLGAAGSSGSPNQIAITNGASSTGRNKWIEFADGGDLGAAAYVELIPNDAEKICFIRNSLSGSRSVFLFQGTYNTARDLEIAAGTDVLVKFSGGGSTATVVNVYANLAVDALVTPSLVATTADINGGTLDGSVIGGSTAAAVTGTTIVANTSLNIAADGATVTGIKDEDNMASNSATKLATQQSIKAYVDAQVDTVDTLSEVLAIGNTSGASDISMGTNQKVQFRDAAIYINSSVDGQLDIVADTEIQIAATTVDLNGILNVSGNIVAGGTVDGVDIAARDLVLTTTTTTANDALPKAGGAMTGAITTNSTFDGRDVAADGTTADNALPKAGGTMTGDTLHGDSVKAKFGAGGDLEIYHDGSDSWITDSGTGNLWIGAENNLYLADVAGNDIYVQCVKDGAVSLRYDHATKLATTSTGIDVTGTASVTALASPETGRYHLIQSAEGNTTYPTYSFQGDSNTGIMSATADTLSLVTGGSERVLINSGGDVSIDAADFTVCEYTVAQLLTDGFSGFGVSSGDYMVVSRFNNVAAYFKRENSDGAVVNFMKDATVVGTITITGSSTAYNTSSDYRLKTNVLPMTGATATFKQLKPVNFEWIADGTRVDGFLAHELQEVIPEAVTGSKDAMRDEEYTVTEAVEATFNEEGEELTASVEAVMGTRSVPDMQGIDQAKIVPLLVATVQELLARIEALEA